MSAIKTCRQNQGEWYTVSACGMALQRRRLENKRVSEWPAISDNSRVQNQRVVVVDVDSFLDSETLLSQRVSGR